MAAPPTPGSESTPTRSTSPRATAPGGAAAASVERFLRRLRWEIGLRSTPDIAWSEPGDDGSPSLWTLYRAMPAPLQTALRNGFTDFIVRVPQAARAYAARTTDLVSAPSAPVSRRGDLWILGRHRVLCGDARKKADVRRVMNGRLAACFWTDPPYGVD